MLNYQPLNIPDINHAVVLMGTLKLLYLVIKPIYIEKLKFILY